MVRKYFGLLSETRCTWLTVFKVTIVSNNNAPFRPTSCFSIQILKLQKEYGKLQLTAEHHTLE